MKWFFLFAIGLAGVGIYFSRHIKVAKPSAGDPDRQTLLDAKTQPSEFEAALLRLANKLDPLAEQTALQTLKDNEDPRYRDAAVSALAFFDDETSTTAIEGEIAHTSPGRRTAAIEALGLRQSPRREAALERINAVNFSVDEKISLATVLAKAHQSARGQQLLRELLQGELTPNQRNSVVMHMMAVDPSAPELLRALHEVLVKADASPTLYKAAIFHLAHLNDENVKKTVPELLRKPDGKNRALLLESLVLLCPPERWRLIEPYLRSDEKVDVKKAALRAVASLDAKVGRAMVERARAGAMKDDREIGADLEALLKQFEQSHSEDLCLRH